MAHARLAPSSAHRWLTCPGSIEQSAGIPNRTTDAAELGTACHWLSQERLEGRPWDSYQHVTIDDQANPGHTKGIPVTEEMREWVKTNTDWVLSEVEQWKTSQHFDGAAPATLACETRVNPGTFYGCPDELWGTADVLIDVPGRELIIADFKYGTGHVEHLENQQLTLYAIGAAERTGWGHPAYRLVVLQPRTGTGEPRDELLTRRELLQRAESYRAAVIAATRSGAPLVASDDGCRWCPAAARCKALQERGLELAMRQFADPRFITESELLLLLAEAKRIRIGLDAAEDFATQRLATGFTVPGWKRVAARSNREWTSEGAAIEALVGLNVEPYERKLISPAQAEKKVPKGMAGLLAHIITKREGGPTLAPESDKRPAIPPDLT